MILLHQNIQTCHLSNKNYWYNRYSFTQDFLRQLSTKHSHICHTKSVSQSHTCVPVANQVSMLYGFARQTLLNTALTICTNIGMKSSCSKVAISCTTLHPTNVLQHVPPHLVSCPQLSPVVPSKMSQRLPERHFSLLYLVFGSDFALNGSCLHMEATGKSPYLAYFLFKYPLRCTVRCQ